MTKKYGKTSTVTKYYTCKHCGSNYWLYGSHTVGSMAHCIFLLEASRWQRDFARHESECLLEKIVFGGLWAETTAKNLLTRSKQEKEKGL